MGTLVAARTPRRLFGITTHAYTLYIFICHSVYTISCRYLYSGSYYERLFMTRRALLMWTFDQILYIRSAVQLFK
jgi:hypothetical protein